MKDNLIFKRNWLEQIGDAALQGRNQTAQLVAADMLIRIIKQEVTDDFGQRAKQNIRALQLLISPNTTLDESSFIDSSNHLPNSSYLNRSKTSANSTLEGNLIPRVIKKIWSLLGHSGDHE